MIRRIPSWSLLTAPKGTYQPAATHSDRDAFALRQMQRLVQAQKVRKLRMVRQ